MKYEMTEILGVEMVNETGMNAETPTSMRCHTEHQISPYALI